MDNTTTPEPQKPGQFAGYAASHAKLYESLCRLRLLIITSAPKLIGRSEYQNSHAALKAAEDLMRHNDKVSDPRQ